MNVLRDLGRRAERLRRDVEAAADDATECEGCGASVQPAYEVCPECGADVEDRASD